MATKETTSKGLSELLIEVQAELKAPKGLFNSFGNYNYRSTESILEALKPILKEKGLLLTITDELVVLGDRYYIKAEAKLSKGEDSISVTAYAREEETKKGMDSSQITGATSSYARKYALNGLFLIDDNKDADTDEYHRINDSDKTPKIPAKPSDKEWLNKGTENFDNVVTALKSKKATVAQVLTKYKLSAEIKKELEAIAGA